MKVAAFQKLAEGWYEVGQAVVETRLKAQGSGVWRVGDEGGLVDVYPDAHNCGAYLGVDEGVLEQDARYFSVANVDVVGPFDGNGAVG